VVATCRAGRGVGALGRTRIGSTFAVLGVLVLCAVSCTAATSELGRHAEVRDPVTGGGGIAAPGTDYDYAPLGFQREEFLLAGKAVRYRAKGTPGSDGKWTAEERTGSAPFTTRVVVVRPSDPSKFNGTVYVEWFNVTGGFDVPVTWTMAHNEILREGAAFVGVTAQAAGASPGGLPTSDPARYGSLAHPGDEYSYDVFSQAGAALRDGASHKALLGDLRAERVIALGESQSAAWLATYVNAVHPLAKVFDGFFLQSRGDEAKQLDQSAFDSPELPFGAGIRADLDEPVIVFQSEYDVQLFGPDASKQHDSEKVRVWQVAGTSHVDAYTGGLAQQDLGDGSAEQALLDPHKASGGVLQCQRPVNAGGQHAVVMAALVDLERWVRDGKAPRHRPRLELSGHPPTAIARDAHGIALGGIRTPIVDVPLAVNAGDGTNAPATCSYFGTTVPLDRATLAALYPRGSADYAERFERAARKAVADGVWLQPEADRFVAAARHISFR